VRLEDLQALEKGTLFKEELMTIYFKILEKVNQVTQMYCHYHFKRKKKPNPIVPREKLLFFTPSFTRNLENPHKIIDCKKGLSTFFNQDIAILPFFRNEEDNRRCSLVVVKPA